MKSNAFTVTTEWQHRFRRIVIVPSKLPIWCGFH